jgi:tRNA-2-methylthio-N6-dimethylallyladenosine synthase
MELVRRVGYASAFSFMYSPRPGTPAATMGAQVPAEVARERLHALQALLWEQQTTFNAGMAGRTMDVLFEKPGRQPGQAIGRSPWLQSVHVEDADHLFGRIVPVEIEHGRQNSLKGRLTETDRPQAARRPASSDRAQESINGA